jgi:hypothetical protein
MGKKSADKKRKQPESAESAPTPAPGAAGFSLFGGKQEGESDLGGLFSASVSEVESSGRGGYPRWQSTSEISGVC